MSEDDEEIDRKCSFSHHGGAAGSLEAAASETRRMAGEAFCNGRDAEAEQLRKFAIWLEKRALDSRKTQKNYEKKFSGGV